jgi:hypothetical protein
VGLRTTGCLFRPKMCVMNPPVLAMANFSRRFVLQTDASSSALGAVLLVPYCLCLTHPFHSGEEVFRVRIRMPCRPLWCRKVSDVIRAC